MYCFYYYLCVLLLLFFNFSDPSLGSEAEKILLNIDCDFREHILSSWSISRSKVNKNMHSTFLISKKIDSEKTVIFMQH